MKQASLVALTFVAGITWAYAHGDAQWIQNGQYRDPLSGELCCGQMDCFASRIDGVKEVAGGYFVSRTGETIPHNRIIWKSPDGAWWECLIHINGKPRIRCLIGPPPGS